MEQRYDIRFNRPEPSSESISRHRDFDALLGEFEARKEAPSARVVPLRQRYLTYVVSAAATVALLLMGLGWLNQSDTTVSEDEYFAARPFVNPPATANVPDLVAEAVIDPEVDQEIPLDDGEMIVSHTALFRDRGNAIRQPVQVHYRQMDEVTEYFLAGVPLSYLEDQQNIQLDAAVILDVYATAAGEPVEIAPSESVPVHLGTRLVPTDESAPYQLYRLDTVNRRWVEAGTVEATIGEADWPTDWPVVQAYRRLERDYAARLGTLEQAQSSPLPRRPEPPRREIGDNPTLELDFLNGLALAEGSDVSPEDLERLNRRGIWEMLPETGDFDLRAFNVVWQEVRLRRLGQDDRYELTLINPEKQERLLIRPILLDAANFQAAKERYERELAAYETALANRDQEESVEVATLRQERDRTLEAAVAEIQAYAAQLPPVERKRYESRRADFRFRIDQWGLYTVARRVDALPAPRQVRFTGANDLREKPRTVFVTDDRHKTLYRGLVTGTVDELPLNEHTAVWLVDEKGELALAKPAGADATLEIVPKGNLPSSATLLRQKLELE